MFSEMDYFCRFQAFLDIDIIVLNVLYFSQPKIVFLNICATCSGLQSDTYAAQDVFNILSSFFKNIYLPYKNGQDFMAMQKV